jgi:hypothetical protein
MAHKSTRRPQAAAARRHHPDALAKVLKARLGTGIEVRAFAR